LNHEQSIISAILSDENSFKQVVDLNVNPELFILHKDVYSFVIDFRTKYGRYPKEDIVVEKFGFVTCTVEYPLEFYVRELKTLKRKTSLQEAMQLGMSLVSENPDLAEKEMLRILQASSMMTTDSDTVSLVYNTQSRADYYTARKNQDGYLGVPIGVPSIDKEINGLEGGTYTVIFARPENFKTWTLCHISSYIWLQGHTVLFITREMTTREIARRIDSILTETSFSAIKNGQYETDAQYELFMERLKELEGKHGFNIVGSDADGGYGATFVRSQIDYYKPDICIIDGAHLMRDDRGGNKQTEILTNISRDLKQLAKDVKLPLLVTTQSNREGDKNIHGGTVYGSDAFLQDADNLIALQREIIKDNNIPSGMRKTSSLFMETVKTRDGLHRTVKLDLDFDKMSMIENEDLGVGGIASNEVNFEDDIII